MKKKLLPMGLLSMAAMAANVICRAHTNVYSLSIPSFAERHGLVPTHFPEAIHVPHETNEICLLKCSDNSAATSWFITTNTYARQPRWDGLSTNVPLSEAKACSLALAQMRLEFPAVTTWKVASVNLCTNILWSNTDYPNDILPFPNIWLYEIHFNAGLETKLPTIWPIQIVLLDGTVVARRTKKRD